MEESSGNFLYDIIESDLREGREDHVHTRFPPEPNGYLHIGSLKAIWINASAAERFGGKFNLRYDDTNPTKESMEFVDSIIGDIRWLGFEPTGGIFYGSDYFDKCYEYAVKLIKDGKAFVCDLGADEMTAYRGTLTEPGRESPWRNRTVEENLDLFERMKNGEFPDGAKTLRAKIDMASPNLVLRDPAIYRIRHMSHHRQGDKWCIYPLYDFAHPIQDAIEGVTHSMCSIEFTNNRPLYDWVVDNIGFEHKPHQYEFARLNVTYTVMSKRYLRALVESGIADGWDDPRLPTICALRRRGYTPSALIDFVSRAGVSRAYSIVDYELLEHCIREELNRTAPRRICVLDPVKAVITNYPEDKKEYFELPNNPGDPDSGTRLLPFTREIYIDREDVSVDPPPKYFRLKKGGEVRLMGSYIVRCDEIITDTDGSVTEVRCTADLETGCDMPADGRKVKGTVHWLSAPDAVMMKTALYDKLFTEADMTKIDSADYDAYLNSDSVRIAESAFEPSLADALPGERFQFVRTGYFCRDTKHSDTFNRIVSLKDSKPVK